jgi:predicted RNase H-like HicB family nuclease
MAGHTIEVVATWDDEAKVWVAESDDVPGLITEAATKEEMVRKLSEIVPELLHENDSATDIPELPVALMWKQLQYLGLKRA